MGHNIWVTKKIYEWLKNGERTSFRAASTHTSKGIFFLFLGFFFLKVYFACPNNSSGKIFFFLFSSQLLIGFPFFEIGCVDLEAGLHCGFGCVKRKTGSSSSSWSSSSLLSSFWNLTVGFDHHRHYHHHHLDHPDHHDHRQGGAVPVAVLYGLPAERGAA